MVDTHFCLKTHGDALEGAEGTFYRVALGEGEGWVLRLRLQRSEPERRLVLAVWRQPEGAAVVCLATTQGIQEEAWAH